MQRLPLASHKIQTLNFELLFKCCRETKAQSFQYIYIFMYISMCLYIIITIMLWVNYS